MSCKIKLTRHNSIPVFTVSGDLTGEEATKLSKKILAPGISRSASVIIDLNKTNYIDSHGLGVLIYTWKTLGEGGCKLIFLDPSPLIRDILQGTNLAHVLTVVDSLESL